jgi:hypothetical protein
MPAAQTTCCSCALALCSCALALTLGFVANAEVETKTASSCSLSAVQKAIDAAASGDTVMVPAGTCSWRDLTIPSGKKITLQGAGPNNLTISGSGGAALNMTSSGSRVTGFAFNDAHITVDGDDWRIDHSRFSSNRAFFDAIFVFGSREHTHPRGLIDHNEIRNTRITVVGWNGLNAHVLWSQPLALGGPQMVFVEDNTFTGTQWTSAIDGNYGGRYVFRHNTLTNMYIEAHSLQGDNHRAIRSWEIYNNTISQSGGVSMWTPMFIRGGTGVIHNNMITGTWGFPGITLDNVRSFESRGAAGRCNGRSPWDANQLANGWPCRDQIGRSTDQWIWTTARPFPPQASEPAYFWNNKFNGSDVSVIAHNGTGAWITAERDYFNNTQRPGYTPYRYPHPLQGGSTSPTSKAATSNLHSCAIAVRSTGIVSRR